MGSGKLQVPGAHGLMSGSSWSFPLTTAWPLRTESVSPGTATIRLMKLTSSLPPSGRGQSWSSACSAPQVLFSAPCRRMEHDDVAPVGVAHLVVHAAHQHALADVERRLHRLARDPVRLHQQRLDPERQADRDRHDHDQLDQRVLPDALEHGAGPCSSGLLLAPGALVPRVGSLGLVRLRLGFPRRPPRLGSSRRGSSARLSARASAAGSSAGCLGSRLLGCAVLRRIRAPRRAVLGAAGRRPRSGGASMPTSSGRKSRISRRRAARPIRPRR